MSSLVEISRLNINAFKATPVSHAEPLRGAISLAEADPRLVADTFYTYYSIVRDLFSLTPEEQATVATVNQQLGSLKGADAFLDTFGDRKDVVLEHMREMGNLNNPHNLDGMIELTRKMNNAWREKQKRADFPTAADHASSDVILGFVNGANDPLINIHFAMCHGIERTLGHYFSLDQITHKKDWLIHPMTDVITVRTLQGNQGIESKVFELWNKPRPDGLGWISQRRVDAYREQMNIAA